MTDKTEVSPGGDGSSSDGDAAALSQIQDQLLRHRMTLRQHEYNMQTLSERLALLVIKTVSSVFFLMSVVLVLVVTAGFFSLVEAYAFLRDTAISLGMMTAFLIGFFTVLEWSVEWIQDLKKFRDGPPSLPTEPEPEAGQSESE